MLGSVAVVAACSVVVARQRQLQKRRRVALSVGCEYLASSLREALARLNIVEDAAAPCQWHDFAALDWDALLTDSESRHRRSSLFVRASLVRKGMLQHYIMKKRFVDVLPDGFSVDLEDARIVHGILGSDCPARCASLRCIVFAVLSRCMFCL